MVQRVASAFDRRSRGFVDRLTARYEKQANLLWRAHVEESPDIHAAGRSLSAAQEQLRAALADSGLEASALEDRFELPSRSIRALEAAIDARQFAAAAAAEAADLTTAAAEALAADGLSLRDVATVLGLSHTRVQQLLKSEASNQA